MTKTIQGCTRVARRVLSHHDSGKDRSTRSNAPPERALAAIKLAELGEIPLVRLLFAMRSVPAYVRGKWDFPFKGAELLYAQKPDFGSVLLAEDCWIGCDATIRVVSDQ